MKRRGIRTWVMGLAVAFCLTPFAPIVAAQNQNTTAQQPAGPQAQNEQKTYYGKIAKLQNGKYALVIDTKANRGYFLDNQKEASKYVEKDVLITGTVDMQTKILHVSQIKPAFRKGPA
ncbi:MAG TPA: hypothetical protein VFL79_15110 [Terriglobia bacterium]|nr:hypothetical protein [Terriglobia bacterium]